MSDLLTSGEKSTAISSERDLLLIDELQKLEEAADRNYQWVTEIIAPFLGRSILEVGSGVGVISKFLVARGDPLILSDHQSGYLTYLRQRFGDAPHVTYQLLDLHSALYDLGDRTIDTIVCLNVLEHIEGDRRALRGFHDLLPAGGRLLLQVPNYPALFGSLDEAYGHFRRYTRRTLAERLTGAGFRVVWMRNFNPLSIPGWILSAKILRTRRLDTRALRLYNALVPLARRFDFLSRFGGLALIACAEKRDAQP
ncbi:MAG: class I SAM-dependent methyltransferase [Candidatus Binatia bacterium]